MESNMKKGTVYPGFLFGAGLASRRGLWDASCHSDRGQPIHHQRRISEGAVAIRCGFKAMKAVRAAANDNAGWRGFFCELKKRKALSESGRSRCHGTG